RGHGLCARLQHLTPLLGVAVVLAQERALGRGQPPPDLLPVDNRAGACWRHADIRCGRRWKTTSPKRASAKPHAMGTWASAAATSSQPPGASAACKVSSTRRAGSGWKYIKTLRHSTRSKPSAG